MTADPMVVASAAVVMIGAIATAAVTIINALGNMKAVLLKASESIDSKAEEIHSLVNGGATKAAEKLIALEGQLAALHTEVGRLQEQRVEDAKTKAASQS